MIIVDEIRPRRVGPRIFRVGSCHMASTEGYAELMEFARRLGLRASWLQISRTGIAHFDLTPGRRREALAAGAQVATSRELIRMACREAA